LPPPFFFAIFAIFLLFTPFARFDMPAKRVMMRIRQRCECAQRSAHTGAERGAAALRDAAREESRASACASGV